MVLFPITQLPPALQVAILGVLTATAATYIGRTLEDLFSKQEGPLPAVAQVALLAVCFYALRIIIMEVTGVDAGTLGVATVVFASFSFNNQPTLVSRFKKVVLLG